MEDHMTDPRDEALRACVHALEEAEEYVGNRADVGDDGVPNVEAWLEEFCAKAITAALAALEAPAVDARADERAACIALVYGHAGSDNDAQRIVDAIRARDATTP
jgi:hypothetical protein